MARTPIPELDGHCVRVAERREHPQRSACIALALVLPVHANRGQFAAGESITLYLLARAPILRVVPRGAEAPSKRPLSAGSESAMFSSLNKCNRR
jgi:hypothetical protein